MPVNDVHEVKIFCRSSRTTAVNVRHYFAATIANPEPTAQEIADHLCVPWMAVMRAVIGIAATARGITVQKIHPLPKGGVVVSALDQGAGVALGDIMPTQVCGLISLRTAFAGRSLRGRFYVPFPTKDASDPGQFPIPAYLQTLTDLGNFITMIQTVPSAGGGNVVLAPVIWSRKLLNVASIRATLPRDRWATIRKRSDWNGPDADPPV